MKLKTFIVLFFLPCFSLIFFHYAPGVLNKQVREDFLNYISRQAQWDEETKTKQRSYIETLSLDTVCLEDTINAKELIASLKVETTCNEFRYFHYAQLVSIGLIFFGLLHLLVTYALSQIAGRSREHLISSFKKGWAAATVSSLLILLGQTVLFVFTLYYFTVFVSNRYFPQILLGILLAGVLAVFKIAKVIFSNAPIVSNENASESISEKQAPLLWQKVRETALQFQTTPPDNILMGLSTAFYVTEFPVQHSQGVTKGRTLFLSAPLMKVMALDEITAIIGHEMGHFKGEDTVLTTMLTPQLIKSDQTMQHLRESGFVGIPSLYAMGVFSYFFDKAIHAFRRERELEADSCAAVVAGPQTAALALLRYSYQAQAHESALYEHLVTQKPIDQVLLKLQIDLVADQEFWQDLAQVKTPHPFDTHPSLSLRLEKLGFSIEALRLQATDKVPSSAFAQLINEPGQILESAYREHDSFVKQTQERIAIQTADVDSVDARKKLEMHFPQKIWSTSPFWIFVSCLPWIIIGAIASCLFLLKIENVILSALTLVSVAMGCFFMQRYVRSLWIETITLNIEGIKLESWKEILKFSDVSNMSVFSNNGLKEITFTFKTKRDPLNKKPKIWWKRRSVTMRLLPFKGKQTDIIDLIFKYYTRQKH